VKPLLTQRSFSLDRLTEIDLQQSFTPEERNRCTEIMREEEAKIKNYLQLQVNKREDLE
jgi:hypothetical protein